VSPFIGFYRAADGSVRLRFMRTCSGDSQASIDMPHPLRVSSPATEVTTRETGWSFEFLHPNSPDPPSANGHSSRASSPLKNFVASGARPKGRTKTRRGDDAGVLLHVEEALQVADGRAERIVLRRSWLFNGLLDARPNSRR
jgi:hypothetical protein